MSGMRTSRSWLLKLGIATVGTYIFSGNCAYAQVNPDSTLPNNSIININGSTFNITGGTSAGGNLFHSFQQFSVPTGSTAFFNNAIDIQNIISRVTGESISNIDGIIRARGTANLFLINPNGIIFGANARLNIGGSFLASTASSLNFADGTVFSAVTPEISPPLLTVSVPIGLQFGKTAGQIRVQAPPAIANFPPLTLEMSVAEILDFASGRIQSVVTRPPQLRVPRGKTLALVGGDIEIAGGNLAAIGGRIELGSVASPNFVSLTPTTQGWALGYEGVQNFQNIRLSDAATINASFGDIQVEGGEVTLTNQSVIFAGILPGNNPSNIITNILSNQNGGDIFIRARQLDINRDSIVGTGTIAVGNSGTVTLETQNLTVRDGGIVETGTAGLGNAGNLTIRATDSVDVANLGLIATGSVSLGNAGQLTIETKKLSIIDGGQILNATASSAKGGSLTINASESVEIRGFRSFLFTDTFGSQTAGDLTINTKKLTVRDGAQVSAATLNAGGAGNLVVNASESVELSGVVRIPSGLFASSGLEGFVATANATGQGGDLRITTGNLIIRDGAQINVSSLGTGVAGRLQIQARSIRLENQGRITAETASGNGGDITLELENLLLLRNRSLISTTAGTAQQGGNGGNITVNIPNGFVVAVDNENSDITANASTGRGGRVEITTSSLFGIQPRISPTSLNDITASSEFGVNGEVSINTPNFDPTRGLVQLPTSVVDASKQITPSCPDVTGSKKNEFIVTGRGGLPPSPDEPLSNDVIWSDTRLPNLTAQQNRPETAAISPHNKSAVEIIPATGWIFNNKGEVTLISHASHSGLRSTECNTNS